MLSDGLLQGCADLLGAIERVGAWPACVQTLLIAQIPKSDGGRRPIGLLPTIVRVWEKVRKPIIVAWRSTINRSYNFASKGTSAQLAAWRQALHAEAAVASGGFSIAGLVDLVKAFEMVRLDLVWRVGLKVHCPPAILRLELEAFSWGRRLTMHGVVGDRPFWLGVRSLPICCSSSWSARATASWWSILASSFVCLSMTSPCMPWDAESRRSSACSTMQ